MDVAKTASCNGTFLVRDLKQCKGLCKGVSDGLNIVLAAP